MRNEYYIDAQIMDAMWVRAISIVKKPLFKEDDVER